MKTNSHVAYVFSPITCTINYFDYPKSIVNRINRESYISAPLVADIEDLT